MKRPRIDVGSIRREQIVEAAVAIIAEQGIQKLSLSEIEERAGMSRGQLTYYFKTKEDILLAVFDRLLHLMHQRVQADSGTDHPCPFEGLVGWERIETFLEWVLLRPPAMPEFHSLQYTFLSQIGHREDFRQALANLYEQWRDHWAQDFAADFALHPAPGRHGSPRALATLVQAILHGLGMQRAADPAAFDPTEMLQLVTDVLGNFLRPRKGRPRQANKASSPRPAANGHSHQAKTPAERPYLTGEP
jgi:AcrR family transcriptional regulator